MIVARIGGHPSGVVRPEHEEVIKRRRKQRFDKIGVAHLCSRRAETEGKDLIATTVIGFQEEVVSFAGFDLGEEDAGQEGKGRMHNNSLPRSSGCLW
jgi:hypothetical protein